MILHARWQGAHHHSRPTLVWLHGFLGSGLEWQPVQRFLGDWPQLSIDLPGHGGSRAQRISGFEQLSVRLNATLARHRVGYYWLIGYSLGGRLALYHACRHAQPSLAGIIVEGAHPGLVAESDRKQRLATDRQWASRFLQQPLRQTLAQWYQQPLFAGLSDGQRRELITRRADNDPRALAAMLLATSLARQPALLTEISRLANFHYFCGEHDRKFQNLAAQAHLSVTTIPASGHNAHYASPRAFAACVAEKLLAEEK